MIKKIHTSKHVYFYFSLFTVLYMFVSAIPMAHAQEPRKDFPTTELKFKDTPQSIQENAKEGKFLPIKVIKKVQNFTFMMKLALNSKKAKQAIVTLGIVVEDDMSSPISKEKLNSTQQQLMQLLKGVPNKNIKGQSELAGGYVIGIIPIKYNPQKIINNKRMGPNDIFTIINERFFTTSETNFEQSKTIALKKLEQAFNAGLHLETSKEYDKRIAARDARLLRLDQEMKEIDQEIAKSKQKIKQHEQTLKEIDEVRELIKQMK